MKPSRQGPQAPVAVFLFLLIGIFALPQAARAIGWISAMNSTGQVVDQFTDNDTVYYSAMNITNGSQHVRVYVVQNYDAWPNGTTLNDASTGYREVTTDTGGSIPLSILWNKPLPGSYDVVADVNLDGLFNHTIDVVDNVSVVGFKVTETPKAFISVTRGPGSASSHDWDMGNFSGFDQMMQFRLSTNQYVPINVNSIALTAGGSGDDRKDVRVIYLAIDSNDNGIYDTGDTNLGYMAYPRDDGIVNFVIPGGLVIQANDSRDFVIAYDMKNGSLGSTYFFDLSLVSGTDTTGLQSAQISGLPLRSAITTISGIAKAATTSTSSTTSSSIWVDECKADSDCGGTTCRNKKITTYTCKADVRKAGILACFSNVAQVSCCADGDCPNDLYCQNYLCTDQAPAGRSSGFNFDALFGVVAIIAVMAVAIGAFLMVRNTTRKPWQGKDEVDQLWDRLKEKWKGRGNSEQPPAAEGGQPPAEGQKPPEEKK